MALRRVKFVEMWLISVTLVVIYTKLLSILRLPLINFKLLSVYLKSRRQKVNNYIQNQKNSGPEIVVARLLFALLMASCLFRVNLSLLYSVGLLSNKYFMLNISKRCNLPVTINSKELTKKMFENLWHEK